MRLMNAVRLAALALLAISPPAPGQELDEVKPDTFLVLKNGAEVRGQFIELKDGNYTVKLSDGRVMTYPAGDVHRMERIAAPSPAVASPSPVAAPAHPVECNTFITEKDVDKAFYTTMKDIKVSKKWYGSTDEMFGALAEKARKEKADGVINVRTWHAPSGFAWAAPHAGGMAIRWTEAGRRALPTLEGRCY